MTLEQFNMTIALILKHKTGYKTDETSAVYYSKYGDLYIGNHGFYEGFIKNDRVYMTTKYDKPFKFFEFSLGTHEGKTVLELLEV